MSAFNMLGPQDGVKQGRVEPVLPHSNEFPLIYSLGRGVAFQLHIYYIVN